MGKSATIETRNGCGHVWEKDQTRECPVCRVETLEPLLKECVQLLDAKNREGTWAGFNSEYIKELHKKLLFATKRTLEELIKEALKYEMTPQDIWDQRVSFAYGNQSYDSTIPRRTFEEIATKVYGPRPE